MVSNTGLIVIELIRKSLCINSTDEYLRKDNDWKDIINLSSYQGLSAIVDEGLEKYLAYDRERQRKIPKSLLIDWIGKCGHQKALFEKNWYVAKQLSELFAKNGIEAFVLKGRSIAQYYPNPKLRYSCDLDLYIDGEDWERACNILKDNGIDLVTQVYKEVEFTYEGIYVELHRYITPIRGNKTLLSFEQYLRKILNESTKTYFEGTRLINPPLMFTVMLYIEHALGDLLHGKLTLKHVVDWVVLRKQKFDRNEIEERCKMFGFHRFLMLIDTLADVVEGKAKMESLPSSYKEIMDSFFVIPTSVVKGKDSWFARRVSLFFDIVRNRRYYSRFGYCSMERFLLNAVWAHFINMEVNL